jgi:hypothetical protein
MKITRLTSARYRKIKPRYIQKDNPGADKESNWLPAANDLIYLVMRLYWPKTMSPSILPPGESTWKPPGIELVKD